MHLRREISTIFFEKSLQRKAIRLSGRQLEQAKYDAKNPDWRKVQFWNDRRGDKK
jgi:hypothetical protein